jgi:hypothetical protein
MPMYLIALLKNPERFSRLSRVVFWFVFPPLIAFTMNGCGSPSIDVASISRIPRGESLVFGRVPRGYAVLLQRGDSGTGSLHVPNDDGTYYWHLPPGDYTLIQLRREKALETGWKMPQTQVTRWRICAEFSVPEDEGSIYIGTLSAFGHNTEDEQALIFRIQDEFESATQALYSRFGSAHKIVQKRMMKLKE